MFKILKELSINRSAESSENDFDDNYANRNNNPDDEQQELNRDEPSDESNEKHNPDRVGDIRQVDNAKLVYKRQTQNGTFEELWIYRAPQNIKEITIRRAILAGTDISPNEMESEDGAQTYEVWAIGNIEMMRVAGLPT